LEKVSSEFEAEVLADLQSGLSEALSRIEAARKQAAEAVAKTLENGERQAESIKRQIIGAAELEARNAELKSLEKAINEVFDLAVKEVSELSGEAHEKSLARLIEEGLDIIGPKATVQCNSREKKAVASAIRGLGGGKAKITLDEQSIETIGGVLLATDDGSVRFDNTYEARLERMRPALRKEVAGILTTTA
jgi:V/A-type H+/Na+-transporting ATPase subunit E